MLRVVVSILAVVCKCMQQCWDMQSSEGRVQSLRLWRPCIMHMHGPYNMEELCKWIQHCCTSLRWSADGIKEMLGVVGSNLWPVSNFVQQLPATCNNMPITCNIQQCWELSTNNVEFVCTDFTQKNKVLSVTRLLPGPVLINLSLWH